MKVRSADDGLAPLLEGFIGDALTVSVRLRCKALGDFEPDKVLDVRVLDLLVDDGLCLGGVVAVLLEQGDRLQRPALISLGPL